MYRHIYSVAEGKCVTLLDRAVGMALERGDEDIRLALLSTHFLKTPMPEPQTQSSNPKTYIPQVHRQAPEPQASHKDTTRNARLQVQGLVQGLGRVDTKHPANGT